MKELSLILIKNSLDQIFFTEIEHILYQHDKDTKYQIDKANTLNEGLEKLSNKTYDIVFLDLDLPNGKGLSVFREVHRKIPDTPIIILSNDETEDVAISSIQLGAQDFIIKTSDGYKNINKALPRIIKYSVERKKQEVRFKRINRLLFAVHEIYNIISIEQDESKILKKICGSLINTRDYIDVFITVFGKKKTSEEENVFRCIKDLEYRPRINILTHPSVECDDCSLCSNNKTAIIVKLDYKNTIFGVLSVSTIQPYTIEEIRLLETISREIAYILYKFRMESEVLVKLEEMKESFVKNQIEVNNNIQETREIIETIFT